MPQVFLFEMNRDFNSKCIATIFIVELLLLLLSGCVYVCVLVQKNHTVINTMTPLTECSC